MQLTKRGHRDRQGVHDLLKCARQNFRFVFSPSVLGRLERQGKHGCVNSSARVFFKLHTERRHTLNSVERREILKACHHAPQ